MAIAPSCCLNIRPPTSPSPPPNARATQAAWFKNGSWRSQCVVGMACIIIGVEMDLASQANVATAKDLQYLLVESKEKTKGDRWSDKRICPPWRLNSLETIVPENLPRPSARRRWEEVGNVKNVPAPAIKVIVKSRSSSNNCFTM